MSAEANIVLPPILRSARELGMAGARVQDPALPASLGLPISAEGVTFSMAQSAAWVDHDHFAVGRWDGSLTLFRVSESEQRGPLIALAASGPSSEGIQMITWMAEKLIATSNDDHSLALWRPNDEWNRLTLIDQLEYDPSLGAANSGDVVAAGGDIWFGVGHANGFVSFWRAHTGGASYHMETVLDVRNPEPPS
jgi:hypothetical protein